jgi:hypothetical protein
MPEGMRRLYERACQQAQAVADAGAKGHRPAARQHPSEHEEAVALMARVRSLEGQWPELALFHAIPNGGDRHKATAGKMRAEGQRAGVPDYFLPVPRGEHHGLYIELKSLTGYPSREQTQWISRLREMGYRAEVVRGANAAWQLIAEYLGIGC